MPVLVSAGAGTHCGVLGTSGGGDLGTSLNTGPGLAPRTHGRILVRMQASIFDIILYLTLLDYWLKRLIN